MKQRVASLRNRKVFLVLSCLATCASPFGDVVGLWLPRTMDRATRHDGPLRALIFGWDGQEEVDATGSYSEDGGGDLGQSCTPEGTAVAEFLSYDRERAGHLARLAVAFSPPERALTLPQIETVDVICVRDDSIDIRAILCEEGACVSLSVPVRFPRTCYGQGVGGGGGVGEELQGCVLQNLDELDAQAGALLQPILQQKAQAAGLKDLDELCATGPWNGKFEAFPSWWIPPECDATLAQDCETIRQLLNEAEFQTDVNALAQDALRKIAAGEGYIVLLSKVAIVGPAGICFKVRAVREYSMENVLDVVHPFDQAARDGESLRAAVLGAIASAEGK